MKLFAPLAAALVITAASSAFAQDPVTTQGIGSPAPASIMDGAHRSRFNAFVASANRPSTQYGQKIRIGAVLPETGMTYAVPADFGARGYRYAIVDNHTVLVHPATHAIIEIVN